MTIAGMAAGDLYTVGAALKRAQDKIGIHPAGAGHLDDFHISRILQPARTGQIRTGITDRIGGLLAATPA